MSRLRKLLKVTTLPRVTAGLMVCVGFVGEVGYDDLPHRLRLIALCAFAAGVILYADSKHLLD